MTEALAALVGAFAGATLGLGAQLLLQWRRDDARLFAAARVLLAAVLRASSTLDESLKKGHWTKSEQYTTRLMTDWAEQRSILAARLADDEWSAVQDAFEALAELDELRSQQGSSELGDDAREPAENLRQRLTGAATARDSGPLPDPNPLSPQQILGGYTDKPRIRARMLRWARRLRFQFRELRAAVVSYAGRNRAS